MKTIDINTFLSLILHRVITEPSQMTSGEWSWDMFEFADYL